MSPIDDPRPFPEVLADWIGRHQLTYYRAAKLLRISQGASIRHWLEGRPVMYEAGVRAMMTLVDRGA